MRTPLRAARTVADARKRSPMMANDPLPSLNQIALVAESSREEVQLRVRSLAKRFNLPVCSASVSTNQSYTFLLIVSESMLCLQDTSLPQSKPVTIDFSYNGSYHRRFRRSAGKQPLVRAVGPLSGHATVLDATAGLARDAFNLALAGYNVTAIERAPILAAMIEDALTLAQANPDHRLAEAIHRLNFTAGDARTVLGSLKDSERPDVVYLDPMYPLCRKNAASKKELRICRALAGDDQDADLLFEQAMACARKRVVVKRHPHAVKLGPDPSHKIRSKMLRFDVYVRTG